MPIAKRAEDSLSRWRFPFLGALFNLVVVAFLGLLLRALPLTSGLGINYKYLLHAHSHVALLGWLYSAFFVALVVVFLPIAQQNKKVYHWQFWLAQVAVLGMLLSFPVQGYAAVSITFSTAHILLSYWFIFQFLKDAKAARVSQGPHLLSFRFVKAALFFMALSSMGPWAMGPIMATGHSGSETYYNAIYFYLHFQYNGWFIFAALGLFFWVLEAGGVDFSTKAALLFYRLMFWALLPAYLLSVLWTKPPTIFYIVGGAAALMQVAALLVLVKMLWSTRAQLRHLWKGWSRGLLAVAAVALFLKSGMQLLSAFPYVAEVAFQVRLFIIGYLHLVLIGFVSLFLFAFFSRLGWINFRSRISRWGMGLFLAAFAGTEALLFPQGTFFWAQLSAISYFQEIMFSISVFLPVGLLLFFLGQLQAAKD